MGLPGSVRDTEFQGRQPFLARAADTPARTPTREPEPRAWGKIIAKKEKCADFTAGGNP
jgi:hypothetical protein